MSMPRSRYGYARWSGAGALVVGGGRTARIPISRISLRTRFAFTSADSGRRCAHICRTPWNG